MLASRLSATVARRTLARARPATFEPPGQTDASNAATPVVLGPVTAGGPPPPAGAQRCSPDALSRLVGELRDTTDPAVVSDIAAQLAGQPLLQQQVHGVIDALKDARQADTVKALAGLLAHQRLLDEALSRLLVAFDRVCGLQIGQPVAALLAGRTLSERHVLELIDLLGVDRYTPPAARQLAAPLMGQRLSDDALVRLVGLLGDKPTRAFADQCLRLLETRPLPEQQVHEVVELLLAERTDAGRDTLARVLMLQPHLSADTVDRLVDRLGFTYRMPVGRHFADVLATQRLPEHHVRFLAGLLDAPHIEPAAVAALNRVLDGQPQRAAGPPDAVAAI
jgi:hypothetical protein